MEYHELKKFYWSIYKENLNPFLTKQFNDAILRENNNQFVKWMMTRSTDNKVISIVARVASLIDSK